MFQSAFNWRFFATETSRLRGASPIDSFAPFFIYFYSNENNASFKISLLCGLLKYICTSFSKVQKAMGNRHFHLFDVMAQIECHSSEDTCRVILDKVSPNLSFAAKFLFILHKMSLTRRFLIDSIKMQMIKMIYFWRFPNECLFKKKDMQNIIQLEKLRSQCLSDFY